MNNNKLSLCVCGGGDIAKSLIYVLSKHNLFNVYWYTSQKVYNNFTIGKEYLYLW